MYRHRLPSLPAIIIIILTFIFNLDTFLRILINASLHHAVLIIAVITVGRKDEIDIADSLADVSSPESGSLQLNDDVIVKGGGLG